MVVSLFRALMQVERYEQCGDEGNSDNAENDDLGGAAAGLGVAAGVWGVRYCIWGGIILVVLVVLIVLVSDCFVAPRVITWLWCFGYVD